MRSTCVSRAWVPNKTQRTLSASSATCGVAGMVAGPPRGAPCDTPHPHHRPPKAMKRQRTAVELAHLAALATASDFACDRWPNELCMVVALLSRAHRDGVRAANGRHGPAHKTSITDVVQSVRLLEDAHRVAPSLGLPWPPPGLDVCTAAACAGHVDVLVRAEALGCHVDVKPAWYGALDNGRVPIMAWLREHRREAWGIPNERTPSVLFWDWSGPMYSGVVCDPNGGPCARAARAGQLQALMWLRSPGGSNCPWDKRACLGAAENGHLHVLMWLRGQEDPCPWDAELCAIAAKNGHQDVLKWARMDAAPRCDWDERTTAAAAASGRLSILKWLREAETPCPWDETTCAEAALNGHLHVLKYARNEADPRCNWNANTACAAAENAHLDILRWIREEAHPPCEWNARTCAHAASNGHLAVLRWLREEAHPPCPWAESTCSEAAYGGHLDVLIWARTEANPICPWSKDACDCAAITGQTALLQWMRTEATPPCPWEETTCAYAAVNGHLALLQWMRTEANPPCPWDNTTLFNSLMHGRMTIFKWARLEANPPCPMGPITRRFLHAFWGSGPQWETHDYGPARRPDDIHYPYINNLL